MKKRLLMVAFAFSLVFTMSIWSTVHAVESEVDCSGKTDNNDIGSVDTGHSVDENSDSGDSSATVLENSDHS